MSDGSEAKTDPASSRKLRKQREKGVVPQAATVSSYFSNVLAMFFLIVAAPVSLAAMQLGIDGAMNVMFQPVEAVLREVTSDSLRIYVLMSVPVVVLALASGILVTLIYQKGFLFSLDPVIPKFEKLNIGQGIKRMFGMRGMVELCVSLTRVTIWTLAFGFVVTLQYENLLASTMCGLSCFTDLAFSTLVLIFSIVMVLFVVFALAETLVQRFLFANDQKMTKTEVKQERKDQMGSSEVRSARKKFRKELEQAAENVGVDKATMAIFYGDSVIAIRFHPRLAPVPMLSAKATTLAESRQIRLRVRENGFLETSHRGLLDGMINKPNGSPVPVELHNFLREALEAMYL